VLSMQNLHANFGFLASNWIIGGLILSVLWYFTRHVSNPWLRHLPRAVAGSLTFIPSVIIEEVGAVLLPALMAPYVYFGNTSPTAARQLWAFGPPALGALVWWLGAALFSKTRKSHRPPDQTPATTQESGEACPRRQTRILLWSLTPLLTFVVVVVSYDQLTRMVSRHEGGIVLLLCLATAMAHCLFGFVAAHHMKHSGAQWRLVVAALFSLVGALFWFYLLAVSMLGLMVG